MGWGPSARGGGTAAGDVSVSFWIGHVRLPGKQSRNRWEEGGGWSVRPGWRSSAFTLSSPLPSLQAASPAFSGSCGWRRGMQSSKANPHLFCVTALKHSARSESRCWQIKGGGLLVLQALVTAALHHPRWGSPGGAAESPGREAAGAPAEGPRLQPGRLSRAGPAERGGAAAPGLGTG